MDVFNKVVSDFRKSGLYPDLVSFEGSSSLPNVKISGKEYLMFGSNNYLGLANDLEVIETAKQALLEHGVGPGGSRLLSGNLELIEEFEKKLAEFIGVEDTITFPTGYMANLAVIPAVMGPFINTESKEVFFDSVIFSDQHNHSTIVDGCRLTLAKKVIYKHNDLNDLQKELEKFSTIKHKLIISESVYSTEGTLTDVKKIVEISKKHDSMLMLDDAHGIGVIGNGRGVKSEFGLKDDPFIYMASFDKALGSTGGVIGGTKEFIEYLRIASRPYIFSSALPAVAAAAALAAIERIRNDSKLVQRLLENSKVIRNGLVDVGFKLLGNGKTPAVPILIGDDIKGINFAREMFNEGIYAPCFRWPAAEAGKSRIRVSVMASHSDSDLNKFIETAKKVGKKLQII